MDITVRDSSCFLFKTEVVKVSKYSALRQKYLYLNHGDNLIGGDCDSDYYLKDRDKKAKKIT